MILTSSSVFSPSSRCFFSLSDFLSSLSRSPFSFLPSPALAAAFLAAAAAAFLLLLLLSALLPASLLLEIVHVVAEPVLALSGGFDGSVARVRVEAFLHVRPVGVVVDGLVIAQHREEVFLDLGGGVVGQREVGGQVSGGGGGGRASPAGLGRRDSSDRKMFANQPVEYGQ